MSYRIEDILYEAYELGVLDEVFKESSKINKKWPNMEVGDRFDKALLKIKEKKNRNGYGKKK